MPYRVDALDRASAIALEELGHAVVWLRREHALSQRGLATRCGLSQPTISRVERGLAPGMSVRTFARLLASMTGRVADSDEFRRGWPRPAPYWNVLHGSFGIGGRIARRLADAEGEREVAREASLRALAAELRR
jgi:transcriptional regulator with XRE-family HTH domain